MLKVLKNSRNSQKVFSIKELMIYLDRKVVQLVVAIYLASHKNLLVYNLVKLLFLHFKNLPKLHWLFKSQPNNLNLISKLKSLLKLLLTLSREQIHKDFLVQDFSNKQI